MVAVHDTMELVVVGHVTRDLINHEERLGGPASFASLAAAALNIRTGVLTACPSDFSLLAPMLASPFIHLCQVPSPGVTTFELDYSGPTRQLFLRDRAIDITAAHIPAAWCGAPVAYVAPVMGELDNGVIERLAAKRTVVGLQGWLRAVNESERIVPALREEVLHPSSAIHGVVFSELDHPDAENIAQALAQQLPAVALTRGARGVTLFHDGRTTHVDAYPANEVDPTGAGDVFGIVFALTWQRGADLVEAARSAAYMAARVVEGPGLGTLPNAITASAAAGSPTDDPSSTPRRI